jgi:hypothetical protein
VDIGERLTAIVPGATVSAKRPRGFRAAFRSATSGVAAQDDVVVSVAGEPDLHLSVPAADDLLVDHLGDAIRVTLAVRHRFPEPLRHLRRLSFDHASSQLRDHLHAGEAQGSLSMIHLNAAYLLPSQEDTWTRVQLARTTAHELWHLIDHWMQSNRYRESMAFRRELGRHFGVETLEHVMRGDHPDARARLVVEVSGYAATNPQEATAELFKDWWVPVNPEPTPAVAFFGELLDRYFPSP